MQQVTSLFMKYSYARRIVIPVACTVLLLCLVMFLYVIPQYRSGILERKKELVREQVNTAWSLLDNYNERFLTGELTLEEAQAKAMERIRTLHYGSDMKDYFWINDTIPMLIMHPYRSDLEGTNVAGFADSRGKHLFSEFAKIVKKQDEGFVDYMWQWKDDPTRIVPKLSFVKEYKPWGWIIGTGLYLEDIEVQVAQMTKGFVFMVAGTFILSFLLLAYTVRQSMETERARQQAMVELQKSNDQYRTLTENSTDFIVRFDSKCRHVFLNKATLELIHMEPEQIIGKTHSELDFPHEMCEFWRENICSVLTTGQPKDIEFSFCFTGDEEVFMHWRLVPEKNEKGDIVSVLSVARDISELRDATRKLADFNNRLKLTNQELIRKGQELEEFIHTVSHDLKAPIISIQGFSQLLKSRIGNTVDETSLSHLDRISANCRMIEALLDDLLELSRIGRIDDNCETIDMNRLIKEIVESFSVSIADRNIQFRITPDLPSVFGRINRIRQIFINLIDNAIKYTPRDIRGIIEIGLAPNSGLDENNVGTFFVRDNGEGIAGDEHEKVFKMFQRARQKNDSISGTGAGLAIVKKIVINHGGSIWLDSAKGQGAGFFFTLPLADENSLHPEMAIVSNNQQTERQSA
ncbi:MAG: cache domain-containing protein [Candidatus Zixiibacteriota bacterium]